MRLLHCPALLISYGTAERRPPPSTGHQCPYLVNVHLCVAWRRPILSNVAKESPLPPVKSTWTVEKKLKGWDAAQTKFFKVPAARWDRRVAACRHACLAHMLCLLLVRRGRHHEQGADWLLFGAQDQGILDQIQRRVGEERLQQRIEEKKRKSWIKRS
jgi:hypothetical protein